MDLQSPAFEDGARIPSKYTCDGDNVSPPLEISDVPASAESLALIVEDPDVPKSVRDDQMWDHWVVWSLSPDTERIEEGETPDGMIGQNTGGDQVYMGPCPPDAKHRYFFKLYALDEKDLGIAEGATKDELLSAMEEHIIETAQLMGVYERK